MVHPDPSSVQQGGVFWSRPTHHRAWLGVVFLAGILVWGAGSALARTRTEWLAVGGAGGEYSSVRVLDQDRLHTRLELMVSGFDRELALGGGEVISVPGWARMAEAGAPDLPVLHQLFQVPARAAVSYAVVSRDVRRVLGIDVAPSPGPVLVGELAPPRVPGPVYRSGGRFPAEEFALHPPVILRDARAVKIAHRPFRYDPARRTLEVTTRLVVDLVYDDADAGVRARGKAARRPPAPVNAKTRPGRPARAFEPVYRKVFANYAPELFDALAEAPAQLEAGADAPEVLPQASGAPAVAASEPTWPDGDRLRIVTVPAYAPLLDEYIAWKQQRGLQVTLDTTSAGLGAAAVKAAIQAQYDTDGLAYVLLVGDIAEVPSLRQSILDGRASDPSYVLLEGDDYYGDALISRISASNPTELQNQLNKILVHERALFADNGWIFRAGVAAMVQYNGTQHAATIRDGMLGHPAYFSEVIPLLEADGAGAAQVRNAIENAGINVLTYYGHGNPSCFYNVRFTTTDALNLASSNGRFPLVHSVGCSVAQFDSTDCLAEAFMNAGTVDAPAGAIAFYGSVENMWVGSGEPGQRFAFTNLYYTADEQTVGALCFESTVYAMSIQSPDGAETLYRQLHLFGDCSTPIWKKSPVRMSLACPADPREGGGVLAGAGRIDLDEPAAADLVIALTSHDPTELLVPESVTVPAGLTSAVFDLTVVNDAKADGSREVRVSAVANGVDLGEAETRVWVHDNESGTIGLSAPAEVNEADGVLAGAARVTVAAAPAEDLRVWLSVSDPTELAVPESVVIAAGTTSAAVDLGVLDDGAIDGSQPVTLYAEVPYWPIAQAQITVQDRESTALVVELPAWLAEGDGTLAGAGRVRISGTLPDDLVVALESSDAGELIVPASVVIPAGAVAAGFDVVLVDDAIADGPAAVSVSAVAAGFAPGVATAAVADNELAGFRFDVLPAVVTSGVPFTVTVTALDTTGAAGSPPAAPVLSVSPAGVASWPAGLSGFAGGRWTGEVMLRGAADAVRLTLALPGGAAATQSAPLEVRPPLAPAAFAPSPSAGAAEVSLDADLAWKVLVRGLIVNGGFETGDFTGWDVRTSGGTGFVVNDGTFDPMGGDSATAPYAEDYCALSAPLGEGTFSIAQELAIPHDAGSARLEWRDRIRNQRTHYLDPDQEFRVLVQDTDGCTLREVFSTKPGDTLLADWRSRSVDIGEFIGRRVRIVFEVQATRYPLNVYLDEIRIASGLAEPVFDVYVGADPALGPAAFAGTTAQTGWALPTLAPVSPVYWQVVSRLDGYAATGEVWQFTTLGVDHFAWDPIPSPQAVGIDIPVTVRAISATGHVLENYSVGQVALSARADDGSAPPMVISELDLDAEDAIECTNVSSEPVDLGGWRLAVYDWLGWPNPVHVLTLPAGTICPPGGTFVLRELGTAPGAYPNFRAGAGFYWSTMTSNIAAALLDASGQVVDFVAAMGADPAAIRQPAAIPSAHWQGPAAAGASVLRRVGDRDQNEAGDWEGGPAGDLNVLNALMSIPFLSPQVEVAVTPAVSGAFVNGAWTGVVQVQEAGPAVILHAQDGYGHSGDSAAFDVTAFTGVTLTVHSEHGSPVPAPGTHAYDVGSVVAPGMADAVLFDATASTQFVCTGWSGTGSVSPASGTGTTLPAFALEQSSALTWLWQTNVLLAVETTGAGTVEGGGWIPLGGTSQVTALPAPYYRFAGWTIEAEADDPVLQGDLGDPTLELEMLSALTVAAAFTEVRAPGGTPEWWLAEYGLVDGALADREDSDLDGDGMSAGAEYIAGTDPTDPASRHHVEVRSANGQFLLAWPSTAGRRYSVQARTSLLDGEFTTLAEGLPATPPTNAVAIGNPPARVFYRIAVELE